MRISDWSSDVCSSDLLMRLWPFEQLPTLLFGDNSHIAASQRAQSLIVYYFLVLPSCLSSTCSITCFAVDLSEASIKTISANTSSQLVRFSMPFRRSVGSFCLSAMEANLKYIEHA